MVLNERTVYHGSPNEVCIGVFPRISHLYVSLLEIIDIQASKACKLIRRIVASKCGGELIELDVLIGLVVYCRGEDGVSNCGREETIVFAAVCCEL